MDQDNSDAHTVPLPGLTGLSLPELCADWLMMPLRLRTQHLCSVPSDKHLPHGSFSMSHAVMWQRSVCGGFTTFRQPVGIKVNLWAFVTDMRLLNAASNERHHLHTFFFFFFNQAQDIQLQLLWFVLHSLLTFTSITTRCVPNHILAAVFHK